MIVLVCNTGPSGRMYIQCCAMVQAQHRRQIQPRHMQIPLLPPLTLLVVQLDFPFSEAAAATPSPASPPAWPLSPPHPQAAPQNPGGSSLRTQPSQPASQPASQAAAGSGQKPPRPPGAAPSRHYAPLSHLAEEGLQRKVLPAGQNSSLQDVPVVAGERPFLLAFGSEQLAAGPIISLHLAASGPRLHVCTDSAVIAFSAVIWACNDSAVLAFWAVIWACTQGIQFFLPGVLNAMPHVCLDTWVQIGCLEALRMLSASCSRLLRGVPRCTPPWDPSQGLRGMP